MEQKSVFRLGGEEGKEWEGMGGERRGGKERGGEERGATELRLCQNHGIHT